MRNLIYLLCLLFSLPLVADDFRDGVVAYQQQNHALALEKWLPLAESGHVLAQTLVGSMYAYGEGVEQDDSKAFHWLSEAAQYGSAQAQYNLAIMYEKGLGVDADLDQARKWFKAAADQGRKDAATRLALIGETSSTPEPSEDAEPVTQPQQAQKQFTESPPDIELSRDEDTSRIEVVFKPRSTEADAVSNTRPPTAHVRQSFDGLKGLNWLKQQSPNNYTIQLAASVQARLINAYIKQLDLNEGYAHTVTIRDDQTWHAIIYGSYPSFSSAKQALDTLPDSWRAWQPWIREFASVTAIRH